MANQIPQITICTAPPGEGVLGEFMGGGGGGVTGTLKSLPCTRLHSAAFCQPILD